MPHRHRTGVADTVLTGGATVRLNVGTVHADELAAEAAVVSSIE